MEQKLVNNLILDASVDGGVFYTRALSNEGRTGMYVNMQILNAAAGGFTTYAEVEQSVDLVNWSSPLFTTGNVVAAPGATSVRTSSTSSAVLAGYVRVKFTHVGAKACASATVDFFDYVP